MRNATTDVMLTASSLEDGESVRIVCPACGGGSTQEESMVISVVDGQVSASCFRASCGYYIRRGSSLVRTRQSPKKHKLRPYTKPLIGLSPAQEQFLFDKVGWSDGHLVMARPMWAPEDSRYAFPIYGPTGACRGYCLRSYDPGASFKALTRMHEAEPHTSWYCHHRDRETVLVEDIPSAVRVAPYVDCVALLGTSVPPEYIQEILAHTNRRLVWALDNDASALAIKLHKKWSLLCESSRVVLLPKDYKNMTEKELLEQLQGANLL